MMMPGFVAEAALAPARGHYAGSASAPMSGGGVQLAFNPAAYAACVQRCHGLCAYFIPFDPTTQAECKAACALVCGPAAGGPVVAAPAGATAGAAAAQLIAAILAGVAIGGLIGWGIAEATTPDMPTGSIPTTTTTPEGLTVRGCRIPDPPVRGSLTRCYWGGAERSRMKAIQDANDVCQGLVGYCSGACPDGTPCHPVVAAIPREDQPWCWDMVPGRQTTVDYVCACGCG